MPAARRWRSNAAKFSAVNVGAGPPRGLRLKICMVLQRNRLARVTASEMPPAMETWTPMGMGNTYGITVGG